MTRELVALFNKYHELYEEFDSVNTDILQKISRDYPVFENYTDKREYFQELSRLFFEYPADEMAAYVGKELLTRYTLEECLKGSAGLGIRDAKGYIAAYYRSQGDEKSANQFTLLAFLEKLCYEHSNYSLVSAAGHAYEMSRYMESPYNKELFVELAKNCMDGIPDFENQMNLLKLRRAADLLEEEASHEAARVQFSELSETFRCERYEINMRILYHWVNYRCGGDSEETLIHLMQVNNKRIEQLLQDYRSDAGKEHMSAVVSEYESFRMLHRYLLPSVEDRE